ncbi:lactonase family protein [Georgenia halophila]|uniref:lactonase family protein n=1 Tax=Georgenia halophila TaxID=620889 RepID=UPI0031E8C890
MTIWLGVHGPVAAGGGVWRTALEDETLAPPTQAAELPNASFVATHPTLPVLYAVAEDEPGAVATFTVGDDGGLTPLGDSAAVGDNPCHLWVGDGWIYVSCYGDGTLWAVPLAADGALTSDVVRLPHHGSGPTARQEGPHVHSSAVVGDRLVVADLGTDSLWSYRLDGGRPGGRAARTAMPAGFGPRHLLVRDGVLLVTGELSGEVAAVEWDGSGVGTVVTTIAAGTRPSVDERPPRQLSHLTEVAGPHGLRHVLVGVRGSDTISTLRLTGDRAPVALELVAEVATVASPRHFAVVGERLLVAGALSGDVGVHRVTDGLPGPVEARVPLPGVMSVLGPP